MSGTQIGPAVLVTLVVVLAGAVAGVPVTVAAPIGDGQFVQSGSQFAQSGSQFAQSGSQFARPNASSGDVVSTLLSAVESTASGSSGSAQIYETPARAGAEAALADLASRGVDVDADARSAAIQGAVAGASLVEASGDDTPPAATVRAAARGAVSGALVRVGGVSAESETIRRAVSGALAGASLSTALGVGQGGTDDRSQVFAAAYGGAEGTVATVAGLSGAQQATLTRDHVQLAALGGAGGGAGAASLLPIFGDGVEVRRTRAAAFGGTAGTLRGTAERLDAGGRVQPGQTLGAALGASAGTLSSTLQMPQLTDRQLSGTSYAVGRETIGRADELTQEGMLETAMTTAVDRLVGDVGGDSVFPSAIVLPSYNVAIGPPRDTDGDGDYEDVNGNRALTYADVVSLSIVHSLYRQGMVSLTPVQREGLDFEDDGVFDWRDVRALDEEITAATNGTR